MTHSAQQLILGSCRRWVANTLLVLLMVGASVADAQIQLHSGLQGMWWNPSRSGEGFQLNIARIGNDNVATLLWYTYDQQGRPLYLVGAAPHVPTSTSLVLDMVSTSGGVFGVNFDPAAVQRPSWGRVTLDFSTCSAGRVRYVSPTFGSGEITVERFGQNLTYTCTAVTPGQTYTYPFVKLDWTVVRRVDAITSAVSCELYARKSSVQYDVYVSFKKVGSGNVFFTALVAATSSSFSVRPASSFLRVDQLPAIAISAIQSNAPTLAQTTGTMGDLVTQMMSGSSLAVRLVPENTFVPTHDATIALGTYFTQTRAAFDACSTQ